MLSTRSLAVVTTTIGMMRRCLSALMPFLSKQNSATASASLNWSRLNRTFGTVAHSMYIITQQPQGFLLLAPLEPEHDCLIRELLRLGLMG